MSITVTKMTPHIGAEISGIKINGTMSSEDIDAIREAFHENLVVVFRDQDIPPQDHIRFTEYFGAVEPHPLKARAGHPEYENLLVLENSPERRGARNDFWHSDITCAPNPPGLTLLHAITVPVGRGDTSFCNMYRAWELLPSDVREKLNHATAKHSGQAILDRNRADKTDGNTDIDVPPPETHPVARRHPDTNKRALFVNKFFTAQIDEMTEEESFEILDLCEQVATREDNIYRHKWRPGDALMWDNRCTMHYADYDYAPDDYRRMHRTTGAGERPLA